MPETTVRIEAQAQFKPLLKSLRIPENPQGRAIGVLIIAGQGPNQDVRTYVKLETMEANLPGTISGHQANTWMRLGARAAGELDREGDIGLIIPAGGKSRSGGYMRGGQNIKPSEAELTQEVIENVFGNFAPQSNEKYTQAEMELENESHNTLYNIINAANIIDERRSKNPNDPNLDNIWIMGSHFHVPRLRVLAALFGIDPSHVLSAEEVIYAASKLKQEEVMQAGGLDRSKFNKQASLQALLLARLGEPILDRHADYFQRKLQRGERSLDPLIQAQLDKEQVAQSDRPARKAELQKKLYIEEQKDAQLRMNGERRWVRGLATEIDYVLPLAGALKNNARLKSFLLHFNETELDKYGINRLELENANDTNLDNVMVQVRSKINPSDFKWQVVKSEWENEEYPEAAKARFRQLGIPGSNIEALSKAEIPPLRIQTS